MKHDSYANLLLLTHVLQPCDDQIELPAQGILCQESPAHFTYFEKDQGVCTVEIVRYIRQRVRGAFPCQIHGKTPSICHFRIRQLSVIAYFIQRHRCNIRNRRGDLQWTQSTPTKQFFNVFISVLYVSFFCVHLFFSFRFSVFSSAISLPKSF